MHISLSVHRRQTVQNLVNSASNEQQRHEKQERLMQDFVTEAGFQAALLGLFRQNMRQLTND